MRGTTPERERSAFRCGGHLPVCLSFCFLLTPVSSPCDDSKSAEELVKKITEKVRQNLTSLPDYTCHLAIDRWRADGSRSRLEHRDKVRLEVAYIGGNELFSLPGADDFRNEPLRVLVPDGAISTGSYALHLHNVFLSGAAQTQYMGLVNRNGIDCHRFEYRLDGTNAGLRVFVNGETQLLGYGGSFWVAAATLDLVRLELSLDNIPPNLGLAASHEGVDYAQVEIGGNSFVLPSRTQMTMYLKDGITHQNDVEFTNCRQYRGEATISFGPPEEVSRPTLSSPEPVAVMDSLPPTRTVSNVALPKGLRLELVTGTPISAETTAIGDEIRAVVKKAVKHKKKIVVPDGAVAVMRVLKLEEDPERLRSALGGWRVRRGQRHPEAAHKICLRLARLEFGSSHAALDGALTGVAIKAAAGISAVVDPEWSWSSGRTVLKNEKEPGEFFVFSADGTFVLQPGTMMVWKTK